MTITRERLEAAYHSLFTGDKTLTPLQFSHLVADHWETLMHSVKTLIDAKTAPTGDKASALRAFNLLMKLGATSPHIENAIFFKSGGEWVVFSNEDEATIRAALQENIAPDDLVKALQYYADRKFWSNRRDHHGGYSIFERDTNGYEVAEKALKGRKCSKCQQ